MRGDASYELCRRDPLLHHQGAPTYLSLGVADDFAVAW